jgi:hypothetical protein
MLKFGICIMKNGKINVWNIAFLYTVNIWHGELLHDVHCWLRAEVGYVPFKPTSFTIMISVIKVGAGIDFVALRVLRIWKWKLQTNFFLTLRVHNLNSWSRWHPICSNRSHHLLVGQSFRPQYLYLLFPCNLSTLPCDCHHYFCFLLILYLWNLFFYFLSSQLIPYCIFLLWSFFYLLLSF